MKCNTIRNGIECTMMEKKGCSVYRGMCVPVISDCQGCQNIVRYLDEEFCSIYSEPHIKWYFRDCNAATHVEQEKIKDKPKINPMKAAKRAMKGR